LDRLQEPRFLRGMSVPSAAELRPLIYRVVSGGPAIPGYGFFTQAGAACAVSQTIRFML